MDVNMEDEIVGKGKDSEDTDSFRSGPTGDRGCRDIRDDDNYDGGLMFGVDEGMDLDFPQMDSVNDESRIAKRPWTSLRRNSSEEDGDELRRRKHHRTRDDSPVSADERTMPGILSRDPVGTHNATVRDGTRLTMIQFQQRHAHNEATVMATGAETRT